MIKVEKIDIDIANSGHITNSYIIFSTNSKKAILIDPGDNANLLIETIDRLNKTIEYIIITHAHGDHIGAVEEVRNYYDSKIVIGRYDKGSLIGNEESYSKMLGVKEQNINLDNILAVDDGYIVSCGDIELEVIHTPGHTKGGICLYEKSLNILFTGDTLFYNCYGRCDLFGGNFDDMVLSLRKIYDRFLDVTIYPGHDKIVNINDTKKKIRLLVAINGGKI